MGILRSEEDVDRLVHEVHGEESEHGHEDRVEEQEVPADTSSLLAEAVHMLSHLDSRLSEIAGGIRSLDSRLHNIERLVGVLARILLLPEAKKQELRDKLVREIIENLET